MATSRTGRKRHKWARDVELAAALNQIPIGYNNGPVGLVPIFMFTHEQMQALKPAQVITCWRRDHDPIRHEDGGPETHWNLTWRVKQAHERKSGREQTQRGKDRKIARRNGKHADAMASKGSAMITKDGKFGHHASPELRRTFALAGKKSRHMPHGRNSATKRTLKGKVVPR